MRIYPYQKRAWAEIDLNNLQHNFNIIRQTIGRAKLCCVVKANAYGHGAVPLARMYQKHGADFLAVSNIEEALQLRDAEIQLPILILGYTDPECADVLSHKNISQCVFSKDYATALSRHAVENNVSVKIHVKIDTGMGRLGFDAKSAEPDFSDLEKIYKLPGLEAEGIFTHFASADEGIDGEEFTHRQFDCFRQAIHHLESNGIDVGIRHCANSAAIFDYPQMHLDMVRAGIVLYGVKPSSQIISSLELRPALQLKTIVDFIKEVHSGDSISYGREFVANKNMRVATLPVGYADGLWRSNYRNNLVVEINGRCAPIVGRICMDQCMIDITEIDGVDIGSEVVIYSLLGENSVDNIAQRNGTINYEILCAIGERVPRIYKKNNEIVDIRDNIVKENT